MEIDYAYIVAMFGLSLLYLYGIAANDEVPKGTMLARLGVWLLANCFLITAHLLNPDWLVI